MPRSLTVDPARTRTRTTVHATDIPVHRYDTRLDDEVRRRGAACLANLLRDMLIIREVETLLAKLKTVGQYGDLEFAYRGPAHLSIGQEAAAVGTMAALAVEDHIFGSHRSHGEVIAKGLSAVRSSTDAALRTTMETFRQGRLLTAVVTTQQSTDTRSQAERFLLVGFLAELFGRSVGFNAGMGGSMHAFFPDWGIYPNNAIVGGSAGIATGAGLFCSLHARDRIAVANIGDGATGCGPVWEAMNFASMAQFDRLWDEAHRHRPAVAFVFHNNFYAMGGQPIGETSGYERLSRIGLAFGPHAMHAETVDGNNPLAVLDAMERKRQILLAGRGPVLLDVECYRRSGHSATDGGAYRTKEEIAAWDAVDPIRLFSGALISGGVLSPSAVADLEAQVAGLVLACARTATDQRACPANDVRADPTLVGRFTFSGTTRDLPARPHGDVLAEPSSVPRVRQLAKRSRCGVSADGTPIAGRGAVTVRDALFEAVLHHALHDKRLLIYGEECREWGGAFAVYRGLSEILGYHRLFNAPISEAAIVATAVGYAMEGGRALVELMYADFLGRAGDELFNQLAKWQAMSGGLLRLPVVVRTSVGSKYGAQHSQDWTGLVAHIPGLRVVYPATPYDAKGLLASALAGDDPTVFFESQRMYDTTEVFRAGGVPTDYYRLPIGVPDVKRRGSDLTLLTVGPSLYPGIKAAAALSERFGIEAEVIDARSLVPFDFEVLLASVARTGRLALVSEASERGSALASIASIVACEAAEHLRAPVQLLGAPNWIVPTGELEETYFPQASDILDLVHERLMPLPGYRPTGLRRQRRSGLSARGL